MLAMVPPLSIKKKFKVSKFQELEAGLAEPTTLSLLPQFLGCRFKNAPTAPR
jgi:hypothetical protein